MKRTWLCIGGIEDGVIRTLDDHQVQGGAIAFVNIPTELTVGTKIDCMATYKVSVKGGICARVTGGVLTHESVNPVQAYKMLVEQYTNKLPTQPSHKNVLQFKFPTKSTSPKQCGGVVEDAETVKPSDTLY